MQRLREWDYYYTNPGHASLHNAYRAGYSWLGPKGTDPDGAPKECSGVMQMDGQCEAVAAVMELMAHSPASAKMGRSRSGRRNNSLIKAYHRRKDSLMKTDCVLHKSLIKK